MPDHLTLPQPCRWIRAADVPGGRFLVPGCWNRAVYGDNADCHCALRRPVCKACGQEVRHA